MQTVSTKKDIITQRLSAEEWVERSEQHTRRVSDRINGYLRRRRHQQKDPVMDFLFEYYAFRPSHLKQWTPGVGTLLESDPLERYPEFSELRVDPEGAWLDTAFFPDKRKSAVEWILQLLDHSRQREPSFGCFGMHEWAMVYRKEKVRHNRVPLRMDKEEIADFVESRPLLCTHYDAYRFFSKPARPMNKFDLDRKDFAENEQAGCLHTNMDLYKWAFKLYPWISSEIIWEAFELAVEARLIDMKASPYDLRSRGLQPIKIETKAGRQKYLKKQREIYEKSVPIRARLIKEYETLAAAVGME